MKHLLVLLITALALPTAVNAFGKYPSSTEALQACRRFKTGRKDSFDGLCKQDYGTNQILYIKNYWCQTTPKKCGKKKVIKRFKF